MEEKKIILKGVRVHNLKNINLKLNPNELIVFTGVSGSGKSSLAFDTIYVEGQRRYIESLSTYARRHLGDMAKPDADFIGGVSPTIAIEQKTAGRTPRSTVATMTGIYDYLRVLYARIGINHCPISLEVVTPRSTANIIQEISQFSKIIVLAPYAKGKKGEFKEDLAELLRKGFTRVRLDGKIVEITEEISIEKNVAHDIDLVIDRLNAEEKERLTEAVSHALELGKGVMSVLHGEEETLYSTHSFSPKSGISYGPLEPYDFSFNHPLGMCPACQGLGCAVCKGDRIKPYPAATTIGKKTLPDLCRMSIDAAASFFDKLKLNSEELLIAEELLKEIRERLSFLKGVGLHYLTLERIAPTLSGGESQRVRLASQIGSGLIGATYVLDEPSIGLHPRDNLKLLQMLKNLKSKGNTVIVVEHDEETMREADFIVDVGPLAGTEGGQIVAAGSFDDIVACKESITGKYLSGELSIPVPKIRRKSKESFTLKNAHLHNLKNLTVSFPLRVFIAVTGVSGSGKSSLITDTLYPALEKAICIDQSPIGRTPRSNPATYIKVFDAIRDLYSSLPESVAHGYGAGRFSFNSDEGSCPHCNGVGMIKIDMDFMEDEYVVCQHCKGKRFDQNTLGITYKGKNIADVLDMTIGEAYEFFSSIPQIKHKLEVLVRVGLPYIKLGQPSPTLSGGEAQRIKLARELSKKESGDTFYILDEPTTGLHFHDITKLISVLQALVDRGNTVLVIEHNMDLVKTADWIIELGPEGGDAGGQVIAEGTPEKIAKLKTATGIALNPVVAHKKQRLAAQSHVPAITIVGASQNNLKNVSAQIPRNKITICTGPSGSGKSSFAFETIYAEGQRRYIESLSPYARQFVKQSPKPKVESIEGLSASIAIEQKHHAGSPRSTLGTITEAYDFLRVLYAHLGTAHDPETGEILQTVSKDYVIDKLLELPQNTKVQILSPIKEINNNLLKQGYLRIRLNGTYYELEDNIPYDKGRKNEIYLVIDRVMINGTVKKRLFDAISQAGNTFIAALEDKDLFFNLAFAAPSTGKSYPSITPHIFSFNTEIGMCPDCQGLGVQYGADLSRYKEILKLSPLQLMHALWKDNSSRAATSLFTKVMKNEKIDPKLPLKELSQLELQFFLYGKKDSQWVGLNNVFIRLSKSALKSFIAPLLDESLCHSCEGARINPLGRNVRIYPNNSKNSDLSAPKSRDSASAKGSVLINTDPFAIAESRELSRSSDPNSWSCLGMNGQSIADICSLNIDEALKFVKTLEVSGFLEDTLNQLIQRLSFLKKIGLGYLSLNRGARTLSGGEIQRTYLARQLGSGLTGCLYVLDEPTIGLHPHNNELLNNALKELCSLGNTLILVEHDPQTMAIADYFLDFGPKAGLEGGQIVARGTLHELMENNASLTGAYLSGRKKIPLPKERRQASKYLEVKGAKVHNLKNIDVSFPINCLTCITGVSGSGKSTLIFDVLKPTLDKDKLIVCEQNPIGQTNRADVSTYVDLAKELRYFFASLPEAKARGLQPRHFSSNHRSGMCKKCIGIGMRTIYLQFLPPVKVVCDACHGFRLNPLSLQVTLRGKHLGHLLNMTVEESKEYISFIPKAARILETLSSVGLSYLKLGQETQTLSGGEAQRLKLCKELSKKQTGDKVYLFDEPSVGLHSEDIAKLIPIFQTLVNTGNTVIIIEHNLEIIAQADHIIDLHDGTIAAVGTPEQIAANPKSFTGKYLKSFSRRID